MPDRILVVAAVIETGGRFLVTQRLRGVHLAGYWEFPGGKIHDGETDEQALAREIQEELKSAVENVRRVFSTTHAYPERTVELRFYRCELMEPPTAMLGQEMRWIARDEFRTLTFPPADAELIERLVDGTL